MADRTPIAAARFPASDDKFPKLLWNRTDTWSVQWSIERLENEPRFVLRWTETGGPPVEPPREQGFGSMLIERSIAYELDGNANVEYRREGLVCTISAPLRAIRPFVPDLHLASAR